MTHLLSPQCIAIFFAQNTFMHEGLLSIMGILTDISTRSLPYKANGDLHVVTLWRGNRGTRFDFSIRITGPNGFIANLPMTGAEIGPNGGAFLTALFPDVQFTSYGEFVFSVQRNGDTLISETLRVLPAV